MSTGCIVTGYISSAHRLTVTPGGMWEGMGFVLEMSATTCCVCGCAARKQTVPSCLSNAEPACPESPGRTLTAPVDIPACQRQQQHCRVAPLGMLRTQAPFITKCREHVCLASLGLTPSLSMPQALPRICECTPRLRGPCMPARGAHRNLCLCACRVAQRVQLLCLALSITVGM